MPSRKSGPEADHQAGITAVNGRTAVPGVAESLAPQPISYDTLAALAEIGGPIPVETVAEDTSVEDSLNQVVKSVGDATRLLFRKPDLDPEAVNAIWVLINSVRIMTQHVFVAHRKIDALGHRLEEAIRLRDIFKEKATKDPMTGVWNKAVLGETGEKLFNTYREEGKRFAYIFLDLDKFKLINDTYGHDAGDYVLTEFARIVQDDLRISDFMFARDGENDEEKEEELDPLFARDGGEEFGLLLPETDERGAYIVAERLRKTIEGHEFIYDGQRIPVTVSLGIAATRDTDSDYASFKKRADAAVYAAKAGGRNQSVMSLMTKDGRISYSSRPDRELVDESALSEVN